MIEHSKISENIETVVPAKHRKIDLKPPPLTPLPYTTNHITTPPAMPPPTHQRDSSHNDTLESLSAHLTQLYTLHLSLASTSPSSLKILQPPHSPSSAILSAWKNAGMSDGVMETLKRLPYLCSQESRASREIAPDTLALNYLDEEGDAVEVWRDPFCLSENGSQESRQEYLENAIPLTSCIGIEGYLLLLDLDSSTYIHLFLPFSSPSYSLFFSSFWVLSLPLLSKTRSP